MPIKRYLGKPPPCQIGLRTTVPFVTAHLEIFHCMHYPVILESDMSFTFWSTLDGLSKNNIKVTALSSFGKWNEPNTPLNRCEISIRFCFA